MAYNFTRASTQYLYGSSPVSNYSVSMACWFKVNDVANTHCLMSLSNNTDASLDAFALRVAGTTAGDPLQALIDDAGVVGAFNTSTSVTAGTWYHGVATFSSFNSQKVYLNGGGTGSGSGTGNPSVNHLNIGDLTDAGVSNLVDGLIAEVAIWNSVLTQADALILAAGYSPLFVQPANLQFYAPLIRDIVDRSGSIALTNNNTATVADHPRIIYPKRKYINFPGTSAAPGALTGSASTGQTGTSAPLFEIAL